MNIVLTLWSAFSAIMETKYLFQKQESKINDLVDNVAQLNENKQNLGNLFEGIVATVSIMMLLASIGRILLSISLIDNQYFFYFSLVVLMLNGIFITSSMKAMNSELKDKDNTSILARHLLIQNIYSIIYIIYDITTIVFIMGGIL